MPDLVSRPRRHPTGRSIAMPAARACTTP
jgi:hypothetical protein